MSNKFTIMIKNSSLIFSIASLLFLVQIIWFAVIGDLSGAWSDKIQSLNESWGRFNSISTIWKLEFLTASIIAWTAINMSEYSKWWNLVAIGHLLMLAEYAFMIGGYKLVQTEEGFNLMNGLANWVFVASNMLWVLGMIGIYFKEKGILRYLGLVLSSVSFILISLIFFDAGTQEQLVSTIMPALLLLYVLNSIVGIRIYKSS